MLGFSSSSSRAKKSSSSISPKKSKVEWLLSSEHFHFKLLLGTAVGVLVIILLAVACFVLTFQTERQARFRAHTIQVMRLSSVIENDIAALENAHRGYLLSHSPTYLENFERRKTLLAQHTEELTGIAEASSQQPKQIAEMREIVLNWLNTQTLAMKNSSFSLPADADQVKIVLGTPVLDQAREILHSIQREEQIALNQRIREQEWAVQSTQVLDFIPRMERAAYEMQKEKRGYMLTGDPAFIESYKRATANFYTFQGHLAVLVADSPAQLAELEKMRAGLENWIVRCAVPDIEAKRAGRQTAAPSATLGEELMSGVRRSMDNFAKGELEIYTVRSAAAAHERILTTTVIDILCAIAAVLMVSSSCYSFIICRRQLKKLAGADVRIRSVIENILDGMVTVDTKGAICSMNPAARQMFGYTANAACSDTFTSLIPKCFDREVEGQLSDCEWEQFAKRTGGITLALAQTRNGATFPVEISLNEMFVDQQKFFVAMIRDVKERQNFEEQLAADRNRLAVTLSSIGDGVITTDLAGNILMANAACETLTGWPAEESAGKKLKTVFDITADGTVKRRTPGKGFRNEAEAILLGIPERATLTARDGTRRVIEQVAAPISDGKNEFCGVVVVFRDITQRLRDEGERSKAETLEQLGLLAGGIAHDFNNLLTAIIGNISLIGLLLPPDEKMNERLTDAKNASLRARDLAQQLLTFARGGSPIKQTASAGKLIEETVSFHLRGAQSRSEVTIAPDLWPAEFDSGQLSQVIANLVVNSDQAMPDGGVIRVTCDNFSASEVTVDAPLDLQPGDYIRVKVRDDGIGISEKSLKRIFDPYFTTKAKGNGLGLATTYSIVKNHGGLITVDSAPQQGALFTVYLPAQPGGVVAPPVATHVEVKEEVSTTIDGKGRVLIVDDEEAIRMLVEFTLDHLGYEVVQADTALKGIELYQQAMREKRRFDVVILDLTLPGGMGGKDALKILLEVDPTVNAIVSSGYATDATMSRYEDMGFRGVIAKPYEASALGRMVSQTIASSRVTLDPPSEFEEAC